MMKKLILKPFNFDLVIATGYSTAESLYGDIDFNYGYGWCEKYPEFIKGNRLGNASCFGIGTQYVLHFTEWTGSIHNMSQLAHELHHLLCLCMEFVSEGNHHRVESEWEAYFIQDTFYNVLTELWLQKSTQPQ